MRKFKVLIPSLQAYFVLAETAEEATMKAHRNTFMSNQDDVMRAEEFDEIDNVLENTKTVEADEEFLEAMVNDFGETNP